MQPTTERVLRRFSQHAGSLLEQKRKAAALGRPRTRDAQHAVLRAIGARHLGSDKVVVLEEVERPPSEFNEVVGLAQLAAVRAFPGKRLGRRPPPLIPAAGRAPKAVRPPHRGEILGTGGLIAKAPLELGQRTGKVDHGKRSDSGVLLMFYAAPPVLSPFFAAPEATG
jgi:hypothetical protein